MSQVVGLVPLHAFFVAIVYRCQQDWICDSFVKRFFVPSEQNFREGKHERATAKPCSPTVALTCERMKGELRKRIQAALHPLQGPILRCLGEDHEQGLGVEFESFCQLRSACGLLRLLHVRDAILERGVELRLGLHDLGRVMTVLSIRPRREKIERSRGLVKQAQCRFDAVKLVAKLITLGDQIVASRHGLFLPEPKFILNSADDAAVASPGQLVLKFRCGHLCELCSERFFGRPPLQHAAILDPMHLRVKPFVDGCFKFLRCVHLLVE
jgi:hypothetical protein